MYENMMRPHAMRTCRTPMPRSHVTISGVPMPPGRTSMIAGACNVMMSQVGPRNIYEKYEPESPQYAVPTSSPYIAQGRFSVGCKEPNAGGQAAAQEYTRTCAPPANTAPWLKHDKA